MESTSCKKQDTSSANDVSLNSYPKIFKALIFFLLRIYVNKISLTRISKYAESGSLWRVPEDNEKYLVENPLFITQLS